MTTLNFLRKSIKSRLVYFVFLFGLSVFTQIIAQSNKNTGVVLSSLNFPVDIKFIEGGMYGIQLYDSITNSTKTHFSHTIKDFYLGATEVSVQEFQMFCKATNRDMPPEPSWGWSDPKLPVVNVTYQDVMEYCNWLSNQFGVPFRLPEWDEWEYTIQEGDFDPKENEEVNLNQVIFKGNSPNKPKCITCMKPNGFGIYASKGNVWEWVTKTTSYVADAAFNILDFDMKTYWAGGSFMEEITKVNFNQMILAEENFRRQDVGFRIAVNAIDYEKGVLLKKAQILLDKIFEPNRATINSNGFFIDDLEFLWNSDILKEHPILNFDEEESTISLCCIGSFEEESDTFKYFATVFDVSIDKADLIHQLMNLVNVELNNLIQISN